MGIKENMYFEQEDVQKYCIENNVRLTNLRRTILDILLESDQPLTAYTILDLLKARSPKANVMSVYRVLEFLMGHKLVHRIENLNAFITCNHLFEKHLSQWLICEECGHTQERISGMVEGDITNIEKETGFKVVKQTIELTGLCQSCQTETKA